MNNITFGKIYKVNAPLYISEKISLLANENSNDNNISQIFDDIDKGKAYPFAYGFADKSSYILTGEEGKKFKKSYKQAWDSTNIANTFYSKELANMHVELAWNDHRDNITGLIQNSPVTTLNVEYNDKTKEVHNISISV
ncbi:hypothetical protein IJ182_04650 [bacterium]|nr:hypothetical protein [bacterium]